MGLLTFFGSHVTSLSSKTLQKSHQWSVKQPICWTICQLRGAGRLSGLQVCAPQAPPRRFPVLALVGTLSITALHVFSRVALSFLHLCLFHLWRSFHV